MPNQNKKKYTYTMDEALQGKVPEFGTDNPNPAILEYSKMISSQFFKRKHGHSPEYYGPAAVMTEEMAEIGVKMGLRKPKPLDEIAKITGYTTPEQKAHLEDVLEEMCFLGFCEFEYPHGKKEYYINLPVIGSGEMSAEHTEWYEDYPELVHYFGYSTYTPFVGFGPIPIASMVPEGGGGAGMHVVPVQKAIEHESQAVSREFLSHWLDAVDTYVAMPCVCRNERTARDDGSTDDPNSWCIGLGDFAKYIIESKKPGRYVTREEVDQIMLAAEERGYVHQIINQDGPDKVIGICNCNVKTCNALRTSMLFNTHNSTASAYRARVDAENCVACGRCVEYCPAGAVKLGQKLKCKDGKPQEYPFMKDSDEHIWWKDHMNPDYRSTNREETWETGTAPCKSACPAHIAIQGYLQMAKEGRYDEALELIKRENPFPAVCGRVCNRKCEEACTRGTIDEAVAIDEVKKFIAQRDLFEETRFIPEVLIESFQLDHWNEKIAIIGAGPAGLSAANYLATKGYKPTVFEKHDEPGGMMVYGIPSYKLQKDVVAAEIDVIRELGVEIRTGVEVGKDVTIQELRDQGYKAFYIAIGCQGSRKAGVEGEDAEGVISAVDHLYNVHALGDKMKVGKKVVVVGGGNVAVDAARTSARLGGEDVQMFCLESRETMPASDEEVEETLAENIAINNGWGPKEFLKDENGKVTGVVFKKCLSVFDENHKFAPKYDENDTITVEADYVITSIGQCIDWGGLLDGENMEFVHGNYPKADPFTYQTSVPDIFVGGDVYHGPSFVVNAIGEGHEAAESLHRYVRPTAASLTISREHRHFFEFDKNNISIDSYDNSKRQKPELVSGIDTAKTFEEYKQCFTEEQVKIETARCLSCGASVVDEVKCIGCGVCTTKCSFDAIHLVRTHPDATNMDVYENLLKNVMKHEVKRIGRIATRTAKDAIVKVRNR